MQNCLQRREPGYNPTCNLRAFGETKRRASPRRCADALRGTEFRIAVLAVPAPNLPPRRSCKVWHLRDKMRSPPPHDAEATKQECKLAATRKDAAPGIRPQRALAVSGKASPGREVGLPVQDRKRTCCGSSQLNPSAIYANRVATLAANFGLRRRHCLKECHGSMFKTMASCRFAPWASGDGFISLLLRLC